MVRTWVIAVDSSRARIFETTTAVGPLTEIEDLAAPEARLANKDFKTDAPGQSSDGAGLGRHAMGSHRDPKEQEAIRFAKRVCETLTRAHGEGRFGKLYIVAAPSTLGRLRERINGAVHNTVAGEVAKNLAAHSVEDIRKHLPDFL